MGLFSPWFLAGLLAAGLPVWLHLLRRHRSEPLRFSSLMFFERRTDTSVKHRRLRFLALLALRIALLALLALAFANPFIARVTAPGAGGQKIVFIALDSSLSMREGNAFSRAKKEALEIATALPAGSKGQVVTFGSQAHLLTEPTEERERLRAAIQSAEPGDSHTSFAELARAVRSVGQASRLPVEVHLLSDMQKTSMPADFADLRLPDGSRLVAHPAVSGQRPNWAVETVTAPTRMFDPGKTRVKATIVGFSTPAARRDVSLVVNRKVVATRAVEIPAGGRATVEFPVLDAPHGLNRCAVTISPPDGLPEDDRFLFSVERADPRRILLIHAARRPQAVLYLRSALEVGGQGAFIPQTVTTEHVQNIAPAGFAAVILSDAGQLPAPFSTALESYLRAGGSVFIVAGPATAVPGRIPWFDTPVAEWRYSSRAEERFQTLGTFDPEYPSFRRAGRWEGVRFYQTLRIEPGNARVVARLGDGTPLLMEKKYGEGRVLLFASALDNIANDFPLHASFVPFVAETAQYLAGGDERPASVTVDSYLELRSTREHGISVEVLDPDGRRALSFQEAASAKTIQAARAGYYEVRRGSGRNELVAVNTDRRESNLEAIPPDTLKLWQGAATGGSNAPSAPQVEKKPLFLGWHILLLVLAVALAESFVAGRYLEMPPEGKVGPGGL